MVGNIGEISKVCKLYGIKEIVDEPLAEINNNLHFFIFTRLNN